VIVPTSAGPPPSQFPRLGSPSRSRSSTPWVLCSWPSPILAFLHINNGRRQSRAGDFAPQVLVSEVDRRRSQVCRSALRCHPTDPAATRRGDEPTTSQLQGSRPCSTGPKTNPTRARRLCIVSTGQSHKDPKRQSARERLSGLYCFVTDDEAAEDTTDRQLPASRQFERQDLGAVVGTVPRGENFDTTHLILSSRVTAVGPTWHFHDGQRPEHHSCDRHGQLKPEPVSDQRVAFLLSAVRQTATPPRSPCLQNTGQTIGPRIIP
jgi:hypothetical protein